MVALLVLQHGCVWVHELNPATHGLLMSHFLRYLSIVWLRTSGTTLASKAQYAKNSSPPAVQTHCFCCYSGYRSGRSFMVPELAVRLQIPIPDTMIWNSLSLIHFYGEGFLCVFP